jgi:peptidoglycan glycosyltransferase
MSGQQRRLQKLTIFLLLGFGLVGISLVYWQLRAPVILAREDNPRILEQLYRIERGQIVDNSGEVLATNTGTPFRIRRHYPFPEAAPFVGYYSYIHGASGVELGLGEVLSGETDSVSQNLERELLHTPRIGRDVRLTINMAWQSRAAELLSQRQGGMLLMALPDGAIRVMVSHPTFDPNLLDEQFQDLVADENAPLLNRTTQGQFPPGGVIGPLVRAVAISENKASLETSLTEVAEAFSIDELDEIFRTLGLTAGPDLPIEVADEVESPSIDAHNAVRGQDSLTVTPVQMARAWGSVANGGVLPVPRLISAIKSESGEWQAVSREETEALIPFSEQAANIILNNMARQQNVAELASTALSGPAGERVAWYVGLAPAADPRYVLVVVVENAEYADEAADIGRALLQDVITSGDP